MQSIIHIALITLLLLLPGTSPAGNNDPVVSPEQIPGTRIVDSEGVIEAVSALPGLVLIDSRIAADRSDGYIEDSVGLTDTDTSCDALARLVPEKTTPVLFYCNGIRCGRSARAAEIAVRCGYQDILWFRNGMEEWIDRQYPLMR